MPLIQRLRFFRSTVRFVATTLATILSAVASAFTAGSKGALSLSGATSETLETLVREGRIRIDGGVVEMSRFRFTREDGQGVLRFASTVLKVNTVLV